MLRLAIALLLLCTAAHAQDANKRAEAEAIHFLSPCHQPTEDRQGLCEINQTNFVDEYILAKSGDVGGMGSTALSFTPPWNEENRQEDIGYPQDQLQACAWRLVIAQLQRGTLNAPVADDLVRTACTPLSPVRAAAAEQRADHLAQELQTSPAAAPGDDWCPRIPWIKADCSAQPSQGPLTSDPTPLSAK
ncbi:MAG TPA: hypothetical protein VHX12_01785 [Acidisoma sp.]|jgi:hypothetical protein|nr:hypothetical protein [Acidisoma sp.]